MWPPTMGADKFTPQLYDLIKTNMNKYNTDNVPGKEEHEKIILCDCFSTKRGPDGNPTEDWIENSSCILFYGSTSDGYVFRFWEGVNINSTRVYGFYPPPYIIFVGKLLL